MIATLCSYLLGSCTNGIKMLDGFTKLCSNYKNGVLLASQYSDGLLLLQTCKSSKFKSNANGGVGR